MFESPWSIVIVLLVVGWLVQFGFSYYQMQNYYRRLSILRRDGLLAVGKGGSQYKGRAYGVLVVDQDRLVIHAEKLTGATVFARLRPVPHLIGKSVEDIVDERTDLGVSKKLTEAFRFAASEILKAEVQPAADKQLDDAVAGELSMA